MDFFHAKLRLIMSEHLFDTKYVFGAEHISTYSFQRVDNMFSDAVHEITVGKDAFRPRSVLAIFPVLSFVGMRTHIMPWFHAACEMNDLWMLGRFGQFFVAVISDDAAH